MTRNTSISLGVHFSDFVNAQIESGRFTSASEVIRAGLRLLEERDARLSALRDALIAGERSGPARAIDRRAFVQQLKHGSGARDSADE